MLTLNIRNGGGNRSGKIIPRLFYTNADIIVLIEFRECKNFTIIKNSLIDVGYLWQTICINVPNKNSIFVATKIKFEKIALDDLPKDCSYRALLLKFPTFSLLLVYFAQRKEKQLLLDYISDKCIQQLMPKGIVIGGFNTAKPYLDEQKKLCLYRCIYQS